MVGDLAQALAFLERQPSLVHQLLHQGGEVDHLGRQFAGPGHVLRLAERLEGGDELVVERHRAGRTGRDHVVRPLGEQGLDVVGRVPGRHLVGAAVARRGAAAGLVIREDHLDPALVEDPDQGLAHFRVGEVDQAAGVEHGPFLEPGGLFDLPDGVAQRLGGDGRQAAAVGEIGQEERQVADELGALGERLARHRGGTQHGVEQPPVVDHRVDGLVQHGQPLVLDQPAADLEDQAGDVDLGRAHVLAGAALDAQPLDLLGTLQVVVPGGEDGADAAGVHLAEHVPADQPEDRADVQAGGAADALQGLLEHRVGRHLGALVVHEDDVQLFFAAVRVRGLAGDDGHVAGEHLGRGRARQGLEDGGDVGEAGHQLLDADDGHMHPGQGGHQAGVALVGDGEDGPGLGHGDVGAGDAHVRLQELPAQLLAGHLDQPRDVGGQALVHLLGEQVGDLLLGHVDGGHDHVRGGLAGQLDDPLAQVGFLHLEPGLLEEAVEMDLLAGHGLGLDHGADVVVAGHLEDVLAHPGRVVGTEHLGAVRLGVLLEQVGEFLEMVGGIGLALGDAAAQFLEVDTLVDLGPVGPPCLGKLAERAGEIGVVQGTVDRLLEFLLHQLVLPSSSTKMMISRTGPCTPMVSTRSMSAVRLGPVIMDR